jgi:hypothetical protein
MTMRQATPRAALPIAETRRPRPGFDARTVGAYVPRLTRKAFERFGFSATTLVTDWASIVGQDLASCTAPERLSWPRSQPHEDGIGPDTSPRPAATLVLAVDPARALDVQYRTRELIERINAYFGYRAVAQIKVRQTYLKEPAAARASAPRPLVRSTPPLDSVSDPLLRAALARMAHGIVMRKSA